MAAEPDWLVVTRVAAERDWRVVNHAAVRQEAKELAEEKDRTRARVDWSRRLALAEPALAAAVVAEH